jgi:Uma2 family endonuclease
MSALLDEAERPEAGEWDVPDGYELVDGRLVEMPMGAESSRVAGKLYYKLEAYCEANPVGTPLPGDIGFRCFPHRPRLLRKPDGSFIRRDRLPDNRVSAGDLTIAPDLAIESVSPNDLAEAVMEKVNDYLTAGVQLVWVLYPVSRRAVVFAPTGVAQWINESGELDGRDVVPGFRCRLADVLQSPEPSGPSETGAAGSDR